MGGTLLLLSFLLAPLLLLNSVLIRDTGKALRFKLLGGEALRVLSQAFALTFLAEWGDRSQIATIALAAAKDPYGVVAGGVVGHAMCTGLAVVGGRMLAARISEKHVAVCGGLIFLGFAVYSFLVEDPQA